MDPFKHTVRACAGRKVSNGGDVVYCSCPTGSMEGVEEDGDRDADDSDCADCLPGFYRYKVLSTS